ncbi:MSCRAMM family adhesin SdrC [Haloferax sp. ATB1]|uniref:MSCRAMM family adhesin SdrC n=1 Tax=Haloferax sp. ATB1 TaxID=1508454 RepID=UPI000B3355B7|nr:MSCRAMM family adhesin SdrC [Haloferax sp. ATB1]
MEFAAPTARDGTTGEDQPTPASADGSVEADTETSPDTNTDMAPDTSTNTEPDADAKADADSVPAHHDPVRLREAYEACETFKEMTDALGVDVTPQTVRNQMIQHGIHEPESYGAPTESASSSESTESTESEDEPQHTGPSNSDEDSASETELSPESGGDDTANAAERDTQVDAESDVSAESASASEPKPDPKSVSDQKSASQSDAETDSASDAEPVAVDTDEPRTTTEDASTATALPPLPASVSSLDCSTEDVCAAVTGAKTLYEVERRLGLDRADVREVLTALDLLDLVTGRMARRDASAASPDDVRTRVHAALVEGTK